MTGWTSDDLDRFGSSEELELASRRTDRSLSGFVSTSRSESSRPKGIVMTTVGAFLTGPDGAFTGSDLLIAGGVTASYFCGDLQPQLTPTSTGPT